MIGYFDTSAVVPLLVAESGSSVARELWEGATRVASVRLVYPESRVALAEAHRGRRLTTRQLRRAVDLLELVFAQLDVVDVDDELARRAGELAEVYGLRGCDAVHLVAADRLRDAELVMVSGDRTLLDASQQLGISTAAVG
jgi:predicted nucleic acid-binding protein